MHISLIDFSNFNVNPKHSLNFRYKKGSKIMINFFGIDGVVSPRKTIIDGSVLPEEIDLRNVEILEINGYDNEIFQNKEIVRYIEKVKNKEMIISLRISYGTVLENLNILKYFPALRRITIKSKTIKSFEYLEYFKEGKSLQIETGEDKRRNLNYLSSSCYNTLQSIDLEFGNLGDYEVISNCTSLETAVIGRGLAPNFKDWSKVPLKSIKFWNYCIFTELEDMAYLSNLDYVMVGACRRFERFKGDNSSIKRLYITGSKRFDITSLKTCPSLKELDIRGSIPLVSLDDLPTLNHLKTLEIVDIKIDFASYELAEKLPSLKRFYFTKGSDEEVIKLSKQNKEILICKNAKGYLNGIQVYDKYDWPDNKDL